MDPVTLFTVATLIVTVVDKATEGEAQRQRTKKVKGKHGRARVINVPMEIGDDRQSRRFEESDGYDDFEDMARRGRYIRDGE